jgi:hypothetical protein
MCYNKLLKQGMTMKYSELLQVYPKEFCSDGSGKNQSICGKIPMAEFEASEYKFRKILRDAVAPLKLRIVFRGPREYKNQAMTPRKNAVYVLAYIR